MKRLLLFFLLVLLFNIGSVAETANIKNAPTVFRLRADQLTKAKARVLAGDPALKPAMDKLLADAGEALKIAPLTVTSKIVPPISGDKHDYMSVGPYWWPDPAKPDGLPYIRKDGHTNPDRYKISDYPKWLKLVENVKTLAYAWYFTNDEKYADHATLLLRTWFIDPDTRMNPNLNFAQAVPGRSAGRCYGLIDTARHNTQIIDALGLLESSNAWTPEDHRAMKDWYRQFAIWMQTSELGKQESTQHNNHGTWYHAQLASIAMFTHNIPLARWICSYVKYEIIPSQIEPDGSMPAELKRTKSLTYSSYNLRALCTVATIGQSIDIDLWNYETPDDRSLRKAINFVAPYTGRTQQWPYKQISEFVPTRDILPVLYQAALIDDRDAYMTYVNQIPLDDLNTTVFTLLYNQAE